MAEIPLTQGMVAIVDTEDFDYLNRWKWCAFRGGRELYYAAQNGNQGGKSHGMIFMHRLILGVPSRKIDHRDRNGLNNRRSNLRVCTHQQNLFNQTQRVNTSSIYKGVSWRKDRQEWIAYIRINGKRKHLGYSINEEQAALAYNEAATLYFGEFARLNIVQEGSYAR